VAARMTHTETLVSCFEWAKRWVSTVEQRTDVGSGYANLPEPPEAADYAVSEDSASEDLPEDTVLSITEATKSVERTDCTLQEDDHQTPHQTETSNSLGPHAGMTLISTSSPYNVPS